MLLNVVSTIETLISQKAPSQDAEVVCRLELLDRVVEEGVHRGEHEHQLQQSVGKSYEHLDVSVQGASAASG